MVHLRFFEDSDFQQLIDWIKTPELLLQWGGPQFRYPLSEEQLKSYVKGANKDKSNHFIYSVVNNTNEVIGHISLGNIDRENESARVGKVLVGEQTLRGKGIGQLMMTQILKVAFEEHNLHRVSLGVFDFNFLAIACYESVGFVKEGLLRDARKMGEQYWSLWEMSMLKDEWEKRNEE
nr:GNAT family protein [Metabacillus malikii]